MWKSPESTKERQKDKIEQVPYSSPCPEAYEAPKHQCLVLQSPLPCDCADNPISGQPSLPTS